MANNDLNYSVNGKIATVKIGTLLKQEDYDAIWAGENGNEGYETENVLNIRNLFEPFIATGKWCDLQIWEKGNAFVDGVDVEKLEDLKRAIEKYDNDSYELVEYL